MTKRAEFSKPTKRQARERSGGLCEASGPLYGLEKGKRCNAPLNTGVEYDHLVRACDGGSNDLSNCRAVCLKCHDIKTRLFDVPQAAKGKRIFDKDNGIRASKRPIPSRGFARKERHPKPSLPPKAIYKETEV